MSVHVGQRWRSLGDGFVLEVISRAAIGWHVRFDCSSVMIIVDEDDLLDPTLYERAAMRE